METIRAINRNTLTKLHYNWYQLVHYRRDYDRGKDIVIFTPSFLNRHFNEGWGNEELRLVVRNTVRDLPVNTASNALSTEDSCMQIVSKWGLRYLCV